MERAKELAKAVLLALLLVAAFAVVGTIDHREEVRHEKWLAGLEERGEWVMR